MRNLQKLKYFLNYLSMKFSKEMFLLTKHCPYKNSNSSWRKQHFYIQQNSWDHSLELVICWYLEPSQNHQGQGILDSGWKRMKLKDKVHWEQERRAELSTSQLCPGQALRERICLPAIFPLGTICNYYHSSLIFNSFY